MIDERIDNYHLPHTSNEADTGLKVGVVIPALNEEQCIANVISGLKKVGYNCVTVIDGRSNDRTVEIAKSCGARVIMQNGRGKGHAVRQVLCRGCIDADIVILMDADGSMRPEEVPRLVKAMTPEIGVVKASRFIDGGFTHDMSLLRRVGNFVFKSIVNLLWSADYTDLCYGFAAFSKQSVRTIAPTLRSVNFDIEAEVFIKAKKMGLGVREVPSIEYRRRHGKSNLSAFMDGFRILRTIIRESLSAR